MSATIFYISDLCLLFPFQNEKRLQFLRTPISLPRKQIGSRETDLVSVSHPVKAPKPRNLCFRNMSDWDGECSSGYEKDFCCFTVRKAALDEEYGAAAWLRAEIHLEDQLFDRYIDSRKRKFAEQEFNALKRRCGGQYAEKCTCVIAVKVEERNGKGIVLNSVVGTLDISIRYLLHGETYPQEREKLHLTRFSKTEHRYGYVSNLCVARLARRHGIASTMLHFAIQLAKSSGVENVFVHVHKDNMPALQLYEKMGFQWKPVDEKYGLVHLLPGTGQRKCFVTKQLVPLLVFAVGFCPRSCCSIGVIAMTKSLELIDATTTQN